MYEIEMRPTLGRQIFAPRSFAFCNNPFFIRFAPLTLIAICFSSLGLSGCGGVVVMGGSSGSKSTDANLAATPSTIEFGVVSLGKSANQKVSLTNKGSDPIQISQLSLSNAAFRVDGQGTLPASLAVGGSLSFNVQFVPTDSTELTSQLSVITTSSSTPAATVKLHGKGSAQNALLSGFNCDITTVTGAVSDTCTLTTNAAAPSGGLLVALSSSIAAIKVPASITVPAGESSVKFNATVSTVSSNQMGTITATQGSTAKSVSISLSPPATAVETPELRALTCASSSFSGAGKTKCTLFLTTASPKSLNVALTSSSSAVSVPAGTTVASGSTAAHFTASVAAVSKAQTVTISATANAFSKSVAIQLKASKSSAPSFSLNTSSLAFGDVPVGKSVVKPVTITSTGTSPVTIKSGSITGIGFSLAGSSFPTTLQPGQAIISTVQFSPSSATPMVGQFTLSSNAGTATVALTGTGTNGASTISALSCASTSITGSLANPCTVTLSGSAPKGGVIVALASSSTAVTVPGGVTIAGGSRTASFTANVAAVGTAQTVAISASANSSSKSISIQLKASSAALSLSTSSLAFGNVSVGTAVAKSVTLTSTGTAPVTLKSDSIRGTGFSVSGGNLPASLKPGQAIVLTVQFNPATAGSATGQLIISTNATTATIALSGTGSKAVPSVSALTCNSISLTGSLADPCKVSLSGSAPQGGVTVALVSSSTNLTIPASVTVPATATSAAFTANAIAVSSAQSVKVTATAGGTSKSVSLQLNPALSQLSVNATTISFGELVINHLTTQVVTLTSVGKAPVTVKSISVTGTGFSLNSVSLPATLNPGQTLLLTLIFNPTVIGSQKGQLTITSNSSTNPTVTIALSGTSNSHQVELNWNAPSGSISNYKVYRASGGAGSFAKLANVAQTTYIDSTVQSGQRYQYYVTSVGPSGGESKPSNTTTVSIP